MTRFEILGLLLSFIISLTMIIGGCLITVMCPIDGLKYLGISLIVIGLIMFIVNLIVTIKTFMR